MKQIILLFEITNNKSLNYTLRERTFLFFSSKRSLTMLKCWESHHLLPKKICCHLLKFLNKRNFRSYNFTVSSLSSLFYTWPIKLNFFLLTPWLTDAPEGKLLSDAAWTKKFDKIICSFLLLLLMTGLKCRINFGSMWNMPLVECIKLATQSRLVL